MTLTGCPRCAATSRIPSCQRRKHKSHRGSSLLQWNNLSTPRRADRHCCQVASPTFVRGELRTRQADTTVDVGNGVHARSPSTSSGASDSGSTLNLEISTDDLDAVSSLDSEVSLEVTGELPRGETAMSEDINPYTSQDALSAPTEGLGGEPELEALLAEGGRDLTIERVSRIFPFALDGFQRKAVQVLLENKSVVVCAPTGAGKTAIAEAGAAAVLARGQRVIYTTPLKALSNQKLAEARRRFGPHRCGLQTGDVTLNRDAAIVIMTTEILRNIMYRTAESGGDASASREARLGDVGLVILDEVHYLGDVNRGSVWEELIINCPKNIQLLAMSATVKNPEDLGGWIRQEHGPCENVTTMFRPVPLDWLFCHRVDGRTRTEQLLDKSGKKLNPDLVMSASMGFDNVREVLGVRGSPQGETSYGRWNNRGLDARSLRNMLRTDPEKVERMMAESRIAPVDGVVRVLQQHDMMPAIWFILSRKDCDLHAIRLTHRMTLTTPQERAKIQEALDELTADQPEAIREKSVLPLLNGVAVHHAGCLPTWKALVEQLFQRGLIKVVFATGTLAAGINMPARATIINNLARKTDDGIEPLAHNELLQMAGRAGRRGFDKQGYCIVLQGRYDGAESAYRILKKGPEPLQSRFAASYSLVLNLLSTYTLDEARDFLSRSFRNYMSADGNARRQAEIEQLEAQAKSVVQKFKIGASQQAKELTAEIRQGRNEKRSVQARLVQDMCQSASQVLRSVGVPVCVLLNLANNEFHMKKVPAWCIGWVDALPGPVAGAKIPPVGPFVACLTADNRLIQASVAHVVGVKKGSQGLVGQQDQQELLQALANIKPKAWSNYSAGNFSCQTSPGTSATGTVALKLPVNIPPSEIVLPERDPQLAKDLQEVQKRLRKQVKQLEAIQTEEQRQNAEAGQDGGQSFSAEDNLALARQLMSKADALKAEMQTATEGTWREFLDVMEILKAFNAVEPDTLRVLPLGQAARSFQAQNELWLSIVLTDPAVMHLDGPQLAGLLGAVLSGEVNRKAPNVVNFTASPKVQEVVQQLELRRELLFELQSEYGLSKWNDTLLVDLRMGGMVEAWAAGAAWADLLAESDMDDGDAARLLVRTIDLLRQIVLGDDMLPWLKESALTALDGCNRKPVAELYQ